MRLFLVLILAIFPTLILAKTFTVEETPKSISSLVCWVDAADTQTITAVSGAVSAIRNKANSQLTLTQGTGSKQPTTGSRTQNGLNVLDFDGTTDYMVFSANTLLSSPFTLFVVAQYDTSTNLMGLIGRQTSSIAGQFCLRKESSGFIFNTFAFGSGSLSSQVAKSGDSSTTIHCVYFQDGGQINYSLNNGSFSTGTARSGYDNAVSTPLGLGCADTASPSNTLDGFVGEVIIYNRILTVGEIIKINRYLANKWGIIIN